MAAVGLEDRGYAVAVARNDVAPVVGRTVVDNYYFDGRISLGERAVDGGPEEPRVVEIVDYDADEWLGLFRLRRFHQYLSNDRTNAHAAIVTFAVRDVLPSGWV